jgi:hypothetical protein
MRICDFCGKSSEDAKSFEASAIAVLKDCALTNDNVYDIFEKLKIKPSIVEKQVSSGDICTNCHKVFKAEVNKLVSDGLKAISTSLVNLITSKKIKISTETSNSAWFHEMGDSKGWIPSR